MALQISPPPSETLPRLREAIQKAIPGARVHVRGGPGHFQIRVVSASFSGKSTLARQRMVYSAIAHLMQGESAPVHAIDRLETVLP